MDNPTFVPDEDIPGIDCNDHDDYAEESRYDWLDSSRNGETSFIEQPAVKLMAKDLDCYRN